MFLMQSREFSSLAGRVGQTFIKNEYKIIEVRMKQMPSFPKIHITEDGKGFEGLAGIKLKSILKGNLILNLSAIQGDKNKNE